MCLRVGARVRARVKVKVRVRIRVRSRVTARSNTGATSAVEIGWMRSYWPNNIKGKKKIQKDTRQRTGRYFYRRQRQNKTQHNERKDANTTPRKA